MKKLKLLGLAVVASGFFVSGSIAEVDRIDISDAGNGGVYGVFGGAVVTGEGTIKPRPDALPNSPSAEYPDILHDGGFNKATGKYEFKFTLTQNAKVVGGLPIDSAATLPSVFVYDPITKEGFMMVVDCSLPAGKTQNICGYTSIGITRPAKGYNSAAEINTVFGVDNVTDVTGGQINSGIGGTDGSKKVGLIVFNELDPTIVTSKVADLLNSAQTINYQMRSVPLPAAAWLFGAALLGLLGFKKNKR